jgi:hypothetical protein
MRRTILALCLLACILPVKAGPYDQPYVLFEADRRSPTDDTRPATIMNVDGVNMRPGKADPVAPGWRNVEVSVPGARGMSDPQRQMLKIETEPCMRYYLAAKRSSRTAKDWQAFVAEKEPIGECRKKFKLQ